MTPFTALTRRDLVRFARQPSRIVAAIGTPAVIWLVLGSGFAGSFAGAGATGASYAAYLIPGMASMIVLFSAIFAAIALIEDRNEGFLQGVLVSPAPMSQVLAARLAAVTLVSVAQAAAILLAAPLVGLPLTAGGLALSLAALVLISLMIGGVSLAGAWYVNSVSGFHGVMNLVLMPLWLLSGATFPVMTSAGWLRSLMRLNPLTWPTEALRGAVAGEPAAAHAGAWGLGLLAAAASVGLAYAVTRKRL